MADRDDRETLAWSLLTTRAANWDRAASDHQGLSPSEVAGMLGTRDKHGRSLDERAYWAGLLCCAGDWQLLPRVSRALHEHAYRLATEELWNLPRGPGQLWSLVHLALLEMTGPTITCPHCDGAGFHTTMIKQQRRSCDLCEGTGRVTRTQRSRAELIGVHEGNWRRVWKHRYRGVYSELANWVSDANAHLARQLSARRLQTA